VFIENICGSASSIPASFRKICSIVSELWRLLWLETFS
jgi:hypothetical protein